MNRFILIMLFAVISISAESSVNAEIGARIKGANDITKMAKIYRGYRGNNTKRRIVLQKIDSVFHENKIFYVNKEIQDEIEQDLKSAEPQLVYQAITTSGHLKIKGLKKTIIANFMDADKISGGHASGIRQASMAALEQINDTLLADVYLQLVLDRKDFWFNNDLLMALNGLAVHGDHTCLDAVKDLNSRFESYMTGPANESQNYHKSKVAELLSTTRNILTKLEAK